MRIGEHAKTATGYIVRALPLHKWRRKDGLTSFLADMIALRKTVILCASCEGRMPRKWLDRYDYDLVRGFHADENACDRCREFGPSNMYVARQTRYWAQMMEEKQIFAAMRARERARRDGASRYLVNTQG